MAESASSMLWFLFLPRKQRFRYDGRRSAAQINIELALTIPRVSRRGVEGDCDEVYGNGPGPGTGDVI